ncbi:MAG: ribulose-phosphate 3-epimerase [Gaiellaceae bacterium]
MPWEDWIRTVEVEPSIYAADFSRLGQQIEQLLEAGVRVFHFDVGDGQFVPPITMGPIVLESISPIVHRGGGVLDCHLMVVEPQRHFEQFARAGADSVTVQYEVVGDRLRDIVALAREQGLEIGMAFNPETRPAQAAAAAVPAAVDLVLCLSIHPGYSGQEFMPEALDRISELRGLLTDAIPIQVDGGISQENIRSVRDAGASLFVSGASIFDSEDIVRAYRRLVGALR